MIVNIVAQMMFLTRKFLRPGSSFKLLQKFRGCGSSSAAVSVRQQAWLDAQAKYQKFAPHIIYSSYVEESDNAMKHGAAGWSFGGKESLENDFMDKVIQSKLDATLSSAKDQVEYPKNWMNDYEFYESSIDADGNIDSMHGTADPNIPPSKVPCNGCGAHLHCANVSMPGFIPKEIFHGRSRKELQTIICQRCHFLKYYNIALDVEVSPEFYINTVSSIKDRFALALLIVDLFDMPCSIWPDIQEILGSKRPVFIVGNKVDLLPRDSNNYLNHIKRVLEEEVCRYGKLNNLNIKNISLVSAKTGYGIEELITQLHKIWKYKGDVFVVGCTNVGKSTLFNILLNSDYCRPEASSLVRKATACPWPGTTLQMLKFPIYRPSEIRMTQRFRRLFSERAQRAAEEKLRFDQAKKTGSEKYARLIGKVGRTFSNNQDDIFDTFSMSQGTQPIITLNERSAEYSLSKWCYDTPGVLHPEQITNHLTTEELLKMQPDQMICPRAFRFSPGMSIFLAGLARLDFLRCSMKGLNWIQVFIFSSLQLPIVISRVEAASDMYKKYLGTNILGLPFGTTERLSRWPGLEPCSEEIRIIGEPFDSRAGLTADIVLSSSGWIGLNIPQNTECVFKVWTPQARGIHVRTPLVPHAERLIGRRVRNSLAYHLGKPFVLRK